MRHHYEIEYRHILLRPLEVRDIEELRVLRNQNQEFFLNGMHITSEQQKLWYEKYLEKSDDVMFAIELLNNPGVFVGAIALYDMDEATKIAECGRTVIDKGKAAIKGIGTEVTAAVCQIGFTQLHIEKIVASILKSNERILKVDTRAGFVVVGETEDCFNIEMTPDTIRFDPS